MISPTVSVAAGVVEVEVAIGIAPSVHRKLRRGATYSLSLFLEGFSQAHLFEQRQHLPVEAIHAVDVIDPGQDQAVYTDAGNGRELLGDALGVAHDGRASA